MRAIRASLITMAIALVTVAGSKSVHAAGASGAKDRLEMQVRTVDPSKLYVPPKTRRDFVVMRGQHRNVNWLEIDYRKVPGYNVPVSQVESGRVPAKVQKISGRQSSKKIARLKSTKFLIAKKLPQKNKQTAAVSISKEPGKENRKQAGKAYGKGPVATMAKTVKLKAKAKVKIASAVPPLNSANLASVDTGKSEIPK